MWCTRQKLSNLKDVAEGKPNTTVVVTTALKSPRSFNCNGDVYVKSMTM